jgi:hypothetical protein
MPASQACGATPGGASAQPPELELATGACAATHFPAGSQTLGATQSLTDAQLDRHWPPEHSYGSQAVTLPFGSTTLFPSALHDGPAFGAHTPFAQPKPVAQSESTVQPVWQLAPLHAKPPGHAVAMPATQTPAPLQVLVVTESLVQLVPHEVVG